ncbi:unnamed protein product, partial [Prorocentrum cordatum]
RGHIALRGNYRVCDCFQRQEHRPKCPLDSDSRSPNRGIAPWVPRRGDVVAGNVDVASDADRIPCIDQDHDRVARDRADLSRNHEVKRYNSQFHDDEEDDRGNAEGNGGGEADGDRSGHVAGAADAASSSGAAPGASPGPSDGQPGSAKRKASRGKACTRKGICTDMRTKDAGVPARLTPGTLQSGCPGDFEGSDSKTISAARPGRPRSKQSTLSEEVLMLTSKQRAKPAASGAVEAKAGQLFSYLRGGQGRELYGERPDAPRKRAADDQNPHWDVLVAPEELLVAKRDIACERACGDEADRERQRARSTLRRALPMGPIRGGGPLAQASERFLSNREEFISMSQCEGLVNLFPPYDAVGGWARADDLLAHQRGGKGHPAVMKYMGPLEYDMDDVALVLMLVAEVVDRAGDQKSRLQLKALRGGDARRRALRIRATNGRSWPGIMGLESTRCPVTYTADIRYFIHGAKFEHLSPIMQLGLSCRTEDKGRRNRSGKR